MLGMQLPTFASFNIKAVGQASALRRGRVFAAMTATCCPSTRLPVASWVWYPSAVLASLG